MDPFSRLNDFDIAPIVEFLDPIDIIRLQRVSRTWHSILSSEWVARVALISHFPRTAEASAFRDLPATTSAILPYRRAAYRYHTRRLGLPTTAHEVLLDCENDAIEWDAADGYAAWTSHEDKIIRIQSLTEGVDSRSYVSLADCCCVGEGGISETDLKRARMNVQMGRGLLVVTMNFYESGKDGYGYGRRAMVLVFSVPKAVMLWKVAVDLPKRLLGEVDFAQDRLTYIRKSPISDPTSIQSDGESEFEDEEDYEDIEEGESDGEEFEEEDDDDDGDPKRSVLHFVVHDIHTGKVLMETELERSWELSKGDQFFVMVTDRPFKRLIILHEDTAMLPTTWGPVFIRVFSIADGPPGKMLAKYEIRHSPYVGSRVGARVYMESDLYMDYPPKGEVFWVVESCYVYVDRREPAGSITFGDDNEPDSVSFSAWSVQPSPAPGPPFSMVRSVYRSTLDGARDFQRNFKVNANSSTHGSSPPSPITPITNVHPVEYRDRCQRFEIYLPEENCSATFYNVLQPDEADEGRFFRIDVGSYEFTRMMETERQTRVMDQKTRKTLTAENLVVGQEGGKMYCIREGGELEVRGEVFSEFLHGVQWSERHLALRTRWAGDGTVSLADQGEGEGSTRKPTQAGIVVFDFGSPW